MSLSGTRGLVRGSMNLECHRQAAMVADHLKDELAFYRLVTGSDYPGEFGERLSARRRGSKFERNLHQNNAALLRKALGERLGYDADAMYVRNLAEEVPGPPTTMRAHRLARTRSVLRQLAAGAEVPHLIIQPQFSVYVGPSPTDYEHVSPDAVVLDPIRRMYLPIEEKSFIVRDGVADGADLNLARRQAAAQIISIRQEADRVGLADRVANEALFVFATPFGLTAAPPVPETLEQEVFEVERAIQLVREVRGELAAVRAGGDVTLENLIDDLAFVYRESCASMCILAAHCKAQHGGSVRLLGDAAAELLGASTSIARVVELLKGAAPANEEERALLPRIADAADVLGLRTA